MVLVPRVWGTGLLVVTLASSLQEYSGDVCPVLLQCAKKIEEAQLSRYQRVTYHLAQCVEVWLCGGCGVVCRGWGVWRVWNVDLWSDCFPLHLLPITIASSSPSLLLPPPPRSHHHCFLLPIAIASSSPSPLLPPPHHHCFLLPITIAFSSPSFPSPLLPPPHCHCFLLPITIASSSPSLLLPPPHHHCFLLPIAIAFSSPSPLLPPPHHHCFLLPITIASPPYCLQNVDYKLRFAASQWARLELELTRERGLWGPERCSQLDKWTLDFVEGRGEGR